MSRTATEARHGDAEGLDARPSHEILALLAQGQQAASKAVDAAIPAIDDAASLASQALRSGGKLVYVGAGSSGLMAMADALELPGTYGIAKTQITILLAGGVASLSDLAGSPEDDVEQAKRDAAAITADDCVLCVSASGSTPYVVAVAEAARQRGAKVVALANNPGAKLFASADVSILLQTPPEVIAGSTRMGAGTAQKIAFNMLSTLVGVKLGHVHDGHMVNLHPDNEKLRIRAARMVSEIAGVGVDEASRHLEKASGSVKIAVLLARGAADAASARDLLARSGDALRPALADLEQTRSTGFHKRA
ncbi:N-acetylmuramic acid 6-phosphate etherase [Pseudorhizobium tarimense]|uniref:N-acetylmuramic acid 6-phosphate etherase n=1 Tax=Pseudorhizobium tarimense TaxID=1079109 RepID=A0ABV2H2N1_9HYPH|nr:N-acetylmuramic acid 6-phosphate etherase [Pseudorhizobium tarimense]MCJ8517735.1 N-acetylmuramic acid 6-phosphate etherase [Pseudorhizobium tarimense]